MSKHIRIALIVSCGLLGHGGARALGAPAGGADGASGVSIARSAGSNLLVQGREVTAIAVPASAPAHVALAADELAGYLKTMTGAGLLRLTNGAGTGPRRGLLLLGAAAVEAGIFTAEELAETGFEGYRLRARDGNIGIAGGKYWGTYYGAYGFLDRLGARFYAIDFEVVPGPARIEIAALDVLSKPVFEWRNPKFTNMKLGQQVQEVNAMQPAVIDPAARGVHWMHSSPYLVPFDRYATDHPEYFARQFRQDITQDYVKAMAKGSKLHLCLSNPDVRRIATERLLLAIETQPDRRLFTATQSDSWGWCDCDACRKLDPVPGGAMTDRYLDFVNELAAAVARKHPDAIILAAAYGGPGNGTAVPPVNVKPAPNVRIVLAPYTPEVQDKSHWFDHRLNEVFKPWYDGWVKMLPPGQLFIFDYPYSDFKSLSFMHELHFERLKRFAADGVRGLYLDSYDPFMDRLFSYVVSRLAWDPALETRPMVEEFIAAYYGPAAPAIQRIYDRLAVIARPYEKSQGPTIDMTRLLADEEIDALLGEYAEAEKLAGASPEQRVRVRRDKAHLLYTDLAKRNPGNGRARDLALFRSRLAEYIRITVEVPSRSRFRANFTHNDESVAAWFWKVARLRLTAADFQKDPLIRGLLTDPESVRIPPYEKPRVTLLPEARGWRIPLELSDGALVVDRAAYECPERRNVRALRTRGTEYSLMRTVFTLPESPGAAVLALEGQDCEKPGTTLVRVQLNGNELFAGKNPFVERDWSTWRIPLPAGLLKEGENDLVIEDLEEGKDIYNGWVIVADIRIETDHAVKGPPPETLFLAHFDGGINADHAAVPEAVVRGEVTRAAEGKWGGALDMRYAAQAPSALWFNAPGNVSGTSGTVEMWVKPAWDPNEDKESRTLLRIMSRQDSNNGFLLFRYGGRPHSLSFVSTGAAGAGAARGADSASADISHWRPHTWHHLAITWDQTLNRKQIFLDGALAGVGKWIDVPPPDVIYVGCNMADPLRTQEAGVLIDELRISDGVRWQGSEVGERVFDPPREPYAISAPDLAPRSP